MLYLIRSAFCDFASVIAYDTLEETVICVTTSESPDLHPLLAVPCETGSDLVISVMLFLASAEGASKLSCRSAVPVLVLAHDWEGSPVAYAENVRNG